MIQRFLLSLLLSDNDRVDIGAWWVEDRGYDLCQCVLDGRDDRYCWHCFGFRSAPAGHGPKFRAIAELTDRQKREAGDLCIDHAGYSKCACVGEHGPSRLCVECNGTGAVPPTKGRRIVR